MIVSQLTKALLQRSTQNATLITAVSLKKLELD